MSHAVLFAEYFLADLLLIQTLFAGVSWFSRSFSMSFTALYRSPSLNCLSFDRIIARRCSGGCVHEAWSQVSFVKNQNKSELV
jgi:hypothetical protein